MADWSRWLDGQFRTHVVPSSFTIVNPHFTQQTIQILDELNKRDIPSVFEEKKKNLKNCQLISDDILQFITNNKSADDWLCLVSFYDQKSTLTTEMKIYMRLKVKAIIQTYKHLPEKLYKVIENMLEECNALS
jgi:hypothetical protein